MPQGAIHGPHFFNLLMIDLVLFLSETFLSNYADDSNLCSTGKKLNIIKEKLRKDFKVVIDRLFEIHMSLNPTKYHYVYLGKSKENDTFNFGNISLKNSKEVILGLAIDNKVSFDNRVKEICRKANQDLCIIKNIKLFRLKTKINSFCRIDKTTVQLLPIYLNVLLRKIKQLNQ